MTTRAVRIGGASGFWGDAAYATRQLISKGNVDFLVYDYLAEITMSIMARARQADPQKGYATDFVSAAMKPNLKAIAEQNIRVISNAGGVNPSSCAAALERLISELGLDLKVAVIEGDDLIARKEAFADQKEMFNGSAFPDLTKIASMNAYLGAAPIAKALKLGADIVITGRCVDSAVTLGACLAAFDWPMDDFDRLAQASLAGHIIECGPQATGGNFTDWREVAQQQAGLEDIGYPIVEIDADGAFTVTKPAASGGLVSKASVGEQILYEIGDPQTYLLPDVTCDFSQVVLTETGPDQVHVSGAKGRAPSNSYKVCATYLDGWRGGVMLNYVGVEAAAKARAFAEAAFQRADKVLRAVNLGPLTEASVEVIGDASQFGIQEQDIEGQVIEGQDYGALAPQDVVLKLAVKHDEPAGVGVFLKEMTGLSLAAPPGLSLFSAGRPKPSPIVRLFSFTAPKTSIDARITMGDQRETTPSEHFSAPPAIIRPSAPAEPVYDGPMQEVALIKLAWARSGDKGDKANIGVMARDPAYLPWIWADLTKETVAEHFAQFTPSRVERFLLPGFSAINYLLHDTLGGGGVASLRADPQGKTYGQILLTKTISVPADLV